MPDLPASLRGIFSEGAVLTSDFLISYSFYCCTLLGPIASVNNAIVTVLYLLRALHQRIIVYRIYCQKNRNLDDA